MIQSFFLSLTNLCTTSVGAGMLTYKYWHTDTSQSLYSTHDSSLKLVHYNIISATNTHTKAYQKKTTNPTIYRIFLLNLEYCKMGYI